MDILDEMFALMIFQQFGKLQVHTNMHISYTPAHTNTHLHTYLHNQQTSVKELN